MTIEYGMLIAAALAGWGLALYLYVRNEWMRRPLVGISAKGFQPDRNRFGGVLVIRNRGPWPIMVEALEIINPPGAMIAVPSPNRDPNASWDTIAHTNREVLNWRLRPHSSGEFPSRSSWFHVILPDGTRAPYADIQVVTAMSRPPLRLKRIVNRRRLHRAAK